MAETKEVTKKPKTVPVFIPKGGRNDDNFVIVMINGKRWQVQKGIQVEVPVPVAEVINHMLEAQEEADAYLDKVAKNV